MFCLCIALGTGLSAGLVASFTTVAAEESIVHRFGPGSFGDPAWERRYNAELDFYRLEPGGWVIDFEPTKEAKSEPLKAGGFRSVFAVDGDFRVTMDYAFGKTGVPKGGDGPGIFLRVTFGDESHVATVGQVRQSDGTWVARGQFAHPSEVREAFRQPISALNTRLSITRVGDTLTFSGGEGNKKSTMFFECDVARFERMSGQVSLWVTSGKEATAVHGVVRSIVVDSESMVLGKQVAILQSSRWRWLAGLFAIIAVASLLWNTARQTRSA